jgi:adenylate cyclase
LRFPLRLVLPYAVALLLLLVLRQARLGETVNLLLHDVALQLRPLPSAAALPIRVIAIEEDDLRQFGWPLEDRHLVAAISRLLQAEVGAIGLDLYRDLGVGRGQEQLRQLARGPSPLVSVFSAIDSIGPIPGTPPERQAYNDLLIDPDGTVRRDLVHVRGQPAHSVALPLRLLETWRRQSISPLRSRLERNPASLPPLDPEAGGYTDLDADGLQRLLGLHRPDSLRSWPLRALLQGQVPVDQLRGTIVLIGARAPSLRDQFLVPLGRHPWSRQPRLMAGVDLHAQRLASLLADEHRQRPGLRAAPGWFNAALALAATSLGVGLGEGIRSLRRSQAAVAAVALGGLVGGLGALLLIGFWCNLALPLGTLLALATAAWTRRGNEQQRQRLQLRQLLGQTTSTAVADELWRQRDQLLTGGRIRGQERWVTLLCADIAGFSGLAQQLQPEALLAWLNGALVPVVEAIEAEGGLLNKFTGDGVLAVFGAPLSHGQQADAAAAVRSALAIRQSLSRCNGQLAAAGQPLVHLRLGLHSGRVLAGSLGSRDRWEYGLIGDAVNCASRIEALGKAQGPTPCRILMSAATRDLAGHGPWPGALWRSLGPLPLSGRSGHEEIWELADATDGS